MVTDPLPLYLMSLLLAVCCEIGRYFGFGIWNFLHPGNWNLFGSCDLGSWFLALGSCTSFNLCT